MTSIDPAAQAIADAWETGERTERMRQIERVAADVIARNRRKMERIERAAAEREHRAFAARTERLDREAIRESLGRRA